MKGNEQLRDGLRGFAWRLICAEDGADELTRPSDIFYNIVRGGAYSGKIPDKDELRELKWKGSFSRSRYVERLNTLIAQLIYYKKIDEELPSQAKVSRAAFEGAEHCMRSLNPKMSTFPVFRTCAQQWAQSIMAQQTRTVSDENGTRNERVTNRSKVRQLVRLWNTMRTAPAYDNADALADLYNDIRRRINTIKLSPFRFFSSDYQRQKELLNAMEREYRNMMEERSRKKEAVREKRDELAAEYESLRRAIDDENSTGDYDEARRLGSNTPKSSNQQEAFDYVARVYPEFVKAKFLIQSGKAENQRRGLAKIAGYCDQGLLMESGLDALSKLMPDQGISDVAGHGMLARAVRDGLNAQKKYMDTDDSSPKHLLDMLIGMYALGTLCAGKDTKFGVDRQDFICYYGMNGGWDFSNMVENSQCYKKLVAMNPMELKGQLSVEKLQDLTREVAAEIAEPLHEKVTDFMVSQGWRTLTAEEAIDQRISRAKEVPDAEEAIGSSKMGQKMVEEINQPSKYVIPTIQELETALTKFNAVEPPMDFKVNGENIELLLAYSRNPLQLREVADYVFGNEEFAHLRDPLEYRLNTLLAGGDEAKKMLDNTKIDPKGSISSEYKNKIDRYGYNLYADGLSDPEKIREYIAEKKVNEIQAVGLEHRAKLGDKLRAYAAGILTAKPEARPVINKGGTVRLEKRLGASQTTTNGCWGATMANLFMYNGVDLTQGEVRAYRPGPALTGSPKEKYFALTRNLSAGRYDFLKNALAESNKDRLEEHPLETNGFGNKVHNQVNGDPMHEVQQMADLVEFTMPGYGMRTVTITDFDDKDLELAANRIREALRMGQPVAITNGRHYVTVTGIDKNNRITFLDSNNWGKESTEDIRDYFKSTGKIGFSYIEKLDPEKIIDAVDRKGGKGAEYDIGAAPANSRACGKITKSEFDITNPMSSRGYVEELTMPKRAAGMVIESFVKGKITRNEAIEKMHGILSPKKDAPEKKIKKRSMSVPQKKKKQFRGGHIR